MVHTTMQEMGCFFMGGESETREGGQTMWKKRESGGSEVVMEWSFENAARSVGNEARRERGKKLRVRP